MKEQIFTARWNNNFSVALGLITVSYVIVMLTSSVLGDMAAFTGLVVIGGFTCAFSEAHSAVRFAQTNWRIKRHTHPISVLGGVLGIAALLLIIFTYNGADIPLAAGYSEAFIALAVIIFVLIGLNILRNALLK